MIELKPRFYYLKHDLAFKHIFGYQNNVEFLADVIENFRNLKLGSLGNSKIVNSVRLNKQIINEKAYELDILVELENGNLINVEMYNNYDQNAEIKSALYAAKVFGNIALRKGEKYDLTRMTSSIIFVKGDKVHKSDKTINKYLIVNEDDITDRMIPNLFQIFIVDVDAKDKNDYNINENLRLWLDFINSESLEELEELASKRDILKRALDEMKKFSEELWIQDFESRDLLIESQHDTALKNAIKETKEEAKLDYEKQRALDKLEYEEKIKTELAKTLLEDTKNIEYVAKITKLPLNEIEELAKELKLI